MVLNPAAKANRQLARKGFTRRNRRASQDEPENPRQRSACPFGIFGDPRLPIGASSPAIPPGYFAFSSPFAFSVRQYGVIRFLPRALASAAAWAAIHAEDAGCNGTCDSRMMTMRQNFAKLVDCRQFTFRHTAHQSVHLRWRGNDECPNAPAFALLRVDLEYFGKALVICQFFLPGFPSCTHGNLLTNFCAFARDYLANGN